MPLPDFLTGGAGDRRAFFRETVGKLADEAARQARRRVSPSPALRPPGALHEIAFLAACTRCGACIDVCPVHAIMKAPPAAGLSVGTPMIDPKIQPCTVCPDMPCARACPTEALQPPPGMWDGYRLAVLELDSDRCIAFDGVACGVCARVCPVGERAIGLDGGGRPVLRPEGCVGCGVCVKACVTSPSSLSLRLDVP